MVVDRHARCPPAHQEQFGVQYLVQGYFNMQTRGIEPVTFRQWDAGSSPEPEPSLSSIHYCYLMKITIHFSWQADTSSSSVSYYSIVVQSSLPSPEEWQLWNQLIVTHSSVYCSVVTSNGSSKSYGSMGGQSSCFSESVAIDLSICNFFIKMCHQKVTRNTSVRLKDMFLHHYEHKHFSLFHSFLR